jgi:enoyl-CoA hydratase/carnithine racemase
MQRRKLSDKGETMKEEVLLVEKKGNVCTLEINRPRIMNAIHADVIHRLTAAFDSIGEDETVRVVVLTGGGGNFSSGADLKVLAEAEYAPETLNLLRNLRKLIMRMREVPQPIVAKVRGVAYGVGANLALACDFVAAEENARFCEVFVNINAVIDGGGIYFLPRLVGMAKARELAMLGDECSGRRAEEIGLIFKSVPEGELDEEVLRLAERLSEKEPAALSLIKEGLDASWGMTLSQTLEWEGSHQAVMLQSREHKSIIQKLINK